MNIKQLTVAAFFGLTILAGMSQHSFGVTLDQNCLGVFPAKNDSPGELKDQYLIRIRNSIETEIINRKLIYVCELEEIKRIWKEQNVGEKFPDIYNSTQFRKYGNVFVISHGLLSRGVLSNGEINFIAKVVSGDTGISIAAAEAVFPINEDSKDYSARIKKLVDDLMRDIANRPPRFINLHSLDSAKVNNTINLVIQAEDPDGDTLKIDIQEIKGAETVRIGNGITTFKYTPPYELEGQTVGVDISVSDGRLTESGKIYIKVLESDSYLYRRSYGFGLLFGIGRSKLCLDCGGYMITAFEMGCFAKKYLTQNLTIQPEIHFATRGTKGDFYYQNVSEPTGRRFEYDLSYLDIYLLGMLGNGRTSLTRFKVLAGPYLGFNLKAQYKKIDQLEFTEDIKLSANTDVGIIFGIGIEYGGFGGGKPLLTFDARIFRGLKQLSDVNLPDMGATLLRGKNIGFLIMLGIGY